MSDILLSIKDLHASIGEREILKGIDLDIRPGEIHAVMGPNGAGKSTLSAVLAGRPDYTVTAGSASFRGRDLLALSPEERAWEGLFLSFQYPVEIPGVTITNFLKTAVNSARKARGEEPMKGAEFLKLMKEKMAFVQMKGEFAKREVNVGFSGGEKKRNEIFQMAHPGRDRQRSGRGCLADCGRWRERPAHTGKGCHHHYPLPETAGVRGARCGACPQGGPHRSHGRP